MKPENETVIRAHTEAVLAKMHLLDGLMDAGSPMPERARQNLLVARSIMARIIRREEEKKNAEAA